MWRGRAVVRRGPGSGPGASGVLAGQGSACGGVRPRLRAGAGSDAQGAAGGLSTFSTIFADTASISLSVRVAFVGCSRTVSATDFFPAPTCSAALGPRNSSNTRTLSISPLSAPAAALTRACASTRHRRRRRSHARPPAAAPAPAPAASRCSCAAPGFPRARGCRPPPAPSPPSPRAPGDAARRRRPAPSSGPGRCARGGRDATSPSPPRRICTFAGAPMAARIASASALTSKTSTGRRRAEGVARRPCGRPAGRADARRCSPGSPPGKTGPTSNSAMSAKPRAWFRAAACSRPGSRSGRMCVISDEIGFSSRSASSPPPNSRAEAWSMKL